MAAPPPTDDGLTIRLPPALHDVDSPAGRELGALAHGVLQDVDFKRPDDVPGLCEFLAPQFVNHNPERTAADAARLVERFLKSPRAAQLAAAPIVRRELEFLLSWPPPSPALPASGREPEAPRAHRYLHGFLDCLYQDAAGRWRLIDYKTNRVAASQVSQVVEQYELQMLVYRLACEQALGQPLAECTLVLLHAGAEYEYQWDAAAERRGVDRITAAMNAIADLARQLTR